jgi:hypothetical protein
MIDIAICYECDFGANRRARQNLPGKVQPLPARSPVFSTCQCRARRALRGKKELQRPTLKTIGKCEEVYDLRWGDEALREAPSRMDSAGPSAYFFVPIQSSGLRNHGRP